MFYSYQTQCITVASVVIDRTDDEYALIEINRASREIDLGSRVG